MNLNPSFMKKRYRIIKIIKTLFLYIKIFLFNLYKIIYLFIEILLIN